MQHSGRTTAILPHYRHADQITRQLESVFGQTRPFAEVIIVDDGSPQDQFDRLRNNLAVFPPVTLIRLPANRGPASACNAGLAATRTEYVTFLAADDVLAPMFLEVSEALLAAHPEAGLCFADPQFATEGEPVRRFPLAIAPGPVYLSPLDVVALLSRVQFTFTNNTTLFHTQAIREAGGFIPSLGSFTDVFAALAVSFRNGCCYAPVTLGTFTLRPESFSGAFNARRAQLDAVLREMLRLLGGEFHDVRQQFRDCAVLPRHDLHSLSVLSKSADGRAYITAKLVGRCLYLALWHRLRPHLSAGLRRRARQWAMRLARAGRG